MWQTNNRIPYTQIHLTRFGVFLNVWFVVDSSHRAHCWLSDGVWLQNNRFHFNGKIFWENISLCRMMSEKHRSGEEPKKKFAEMKNVVCWIVPTEYEMQNSIKQIGNKIANTTRIEVGNSMDANGWTSEWVCGRNSANINLKLIKYVEQTFRLPLLICVCSEQKSGTRFELTCGGMLCKPIGKWRVVNGVFSIRMITQRERAMCVRCKRYSSGYNGKTDLFSQ